MCIYYNHKYTYFMLQVLQPDFNSHMQFYFISNSPSLKLTNIPIVINIHSLFTYNFHSHNPCIQRYIYNQQFSIRVSLQTCDSMAHGTCSITQSHALTGTTVLHVHHVYNYYVDVASMHACIHVWQLA